MRYWLMKSEPDVFSIDDLKKKKTTAWDGVRNYQARNFMMNDMQVGDLILFYHSSTEIPGIVGLAQVSRSARPDASQFDKKSEYYEAAATPEKPRWFCVQVEFVEKFKKIISLDELRKTTALQSMLVLKKGQRLSIQPVTKMEFDVIQKMAH